MEIKYFEIKLDDGRIVVVMASCHSISGALKFLKDGLNKIDILEINKKIKNGQYKEINKSG